jgi:hypothetical protein
MKSFASEVANAPTSDITIYRTLVDGDVVLLHSRYQGVERYAGPVIAFDLFRFKDGKIVEHWGGQESEAPPNLSGRTQVDGPAEVLDRDKTDANRTSVRTPPLDAEGTGRVERSPLTRPPTCRPVFRIYRPPPPATPGIGSGLRPRGRPRRKEIKIKDLTFWPTGNRCSRS